MIMYYDFNERLAFSHKLNGRTPEQFIKDSIDGVCSVAKASTEQDKQGIDFIATTTGGAEIRIDTKIRQAGCSKYWKHGNPDLALETWSSIPTKTNVGKIGWTLDPKKKTDYVLFLYDPIDTEDCFSIPFQSLRVAFSKKLNTWKLEYRTAKQSSGKWTSECIFVPAKVATHAVEEHMHVRSEAKIERAKTTSQLCFDLKGKVTQ